MDTKKTAPFTVEFRGDNTYIHDTNADLQAALNEISKLIPSENKTVICTDPYIFKVNNDNSDYEKVVKSWFISLKAKKIIFCLGTDQGNAAFKNTITSALETNGCECEIKNVSNQNGYPVFHDRYWFSLEDKKGALSGNSINGFGKRVAIVSIAEQSDIETVLSILKEYGVGKTEADSDE